MMMTMIILLSFDNNFLNNYLIVDQIVILFSRFLSYFYL